MSKQLVFTAGLLLASVSIATYAGNIASVSGDVNTDPTILAQNTLDKGATINGETAHERSQRIQQEAQRQQEARQAEKKASEKAQKRRAGTPPDSGSTNAETGVPGGNVYGE